MEIPYLIFIVLILLKDNVFAQMWTSTSPAETYTEYNGGAPFTTVTIPASTIVHYQPGCVL
jgi:hypothetical protein